MCGSDVETPAAGRVGKQSEFIKHSEGKKKSLRTIQEDMSVRKDLRVPSFRLLESSRMLWGSITACCIILHVLLSMQSG